MGKVSIPLIYNVEDEVYNGTGNAFLQNMYVNKTANGDIECIKRPALNSVGAAMSNNPRGVWEEHLYVAGPTTVYYNSPTYNTAFTGSTWTDNGRVIDFAKAGNNVVVINPNTGTYGMGYTLNTTTHVSTAIADADFPPNTNVAIARGVLDLDGYMIILTKAGDIYHSDKDNATSWAALSFIGMSNPGTTGVWITKYRNYVVAFSDHSIEFFYNAGNPSGSILSPRLDLRDNIGAFGEESCWSDESTVAWVSQSKDNKLGVYILNDFRPQKISTNEVDQFLVDSVDDLTGTGQLRVSGFNWQGRTFIVVTAQTAANYSLVYDTQAGIWYRWTYNSGEFNLAGSIKSAYGELLQLFFRDNTQVSYFDHEVYQDDTSSGGSTAAISVIIQTPKFSGDDGSEGETKTQNSLRLIGDRGSSTNNVGIQWSDDDYQNFSTSRNLDVSIADRQLSRCGSFVERSFKLTHTANLSLRLKKIVSDITIGV